MRSRNNETVGRHRLLDHAHGVNRQQCVKVPNSARFVIGTDDDGRTCRLTVAMIATVMTAKMSVDDARAVVMLVIVAVKV